MPMTGASMFWRETLHDCHLDRSLSLPYDRYRSVDEHRTGRGTSISFEFGRDLSHHFLAYASSNDINPQHLALACYYTFLFKLTNGERDLCIGMNTNGRYREELLSVIGMFVNAIPLRCQLDPHWSFQQLVQHVQEMMTSSLEYSYFPLQRILAQHPNVSKTAFLDTSFVFHSSENQNIDNEVMIGGNKLHAITFLVKIGENEIMSKFDFSLTIHYNQSINQLSCTIDASLDLFNRTTVDKIAQRFYSMLQFLFRLNTDDQMKRRIYELPLLLSDDRLLIQSMNNTQVLFPSLSCIHHEFVSQTMKHPQKLSVELDDQSLTYSELLYYVQMLALNLLNEQRVVPGDIISQCVERSLLMVSQ
jgi:non-ribosomal peptide synthetase component F